MYFCLFMQALATTDILPEALNLTTDLLFEAGRSIPGSVQQVVKRYARPASWTGDEQAQVVYHYEASASAKNFLSLRFCLSGNVYCKKYRNECNQCKAHLSEGCEARMESVDFVSLSFSAKMLEPFAKERTACGKLSERLLSFEYPSSFTRTVTLCGRTRLLIESLLNHEQSGSLENIFVNAQTQMLLLNTLNCLDDNELNVINCKFLNNEADREKVLKARDVLVRQIGEPTTIKQLSRK